MTMSITAYFDANDLDELHELLIALRELEPVQIEIEGSVSMSYEPEPDEGEMDLTPPQGITRPHSPTEPPGHIYARETYISALVSWTREHISGGPISDLANEQLRGAYRDILRYGFDTDLAKYGIVGEQVMCVRGAFRDATAGQVPL
jgi:hypothetical protein